MIPTPSASDFAIRVTDLSKQYRIDRKKMRTPLHTLLSPANAVRRIKNGRSPSEKRTFWALGNVTFDVARGERLAIIGKNGAGKSTLLKILSRIVHPTCGEARIRGRLTSLLEVGTGFNDELTGSQNIFMNASYHRLTREEIEQRFDEIVAFSGIDRCFLDMPVKNCGAPRPRHSAPGRGAGRRGHGFSGKVSEPGGRHDGARSNGGPRFP
jgi:lipopolysaccharide transport system ATP-binding protein